MDHEWLAGVNGGRQSTAAGGLGRLSLSDPYEISEWERDRRYAGLSQAGPLQCSAGRDEPR